MLCHSPQSASVGKNVVIRTMHIYIYITINLDISYETDYIIYVVLSKLCTKEINPS
jgi:hypothetical protein